MSAVVFLVNGPGELWSITRPVISSLLDKGFSDIFLWILPCQFASGFEREVALKEFSKKIEGVIGPFNFFRTIYEMWLFSKKNSVGLIFQTGGDPFFGRMLRLFTGAKWWAYSYSPFYGHFKADKVLCPYCFDKKRHSKIVGVKLDVVSDFFRDEDDVEGSFFEVCCGDKDVLNRVYKPTILYIPGSRANIRKNAFLYIKQIIYHLKEKKEYGHIILLSPFISEAELSFIATDDLFKQRGVVLCRGDIPSVWRYVDFCLTQPGTNTIELMYAGIPTVVAVPFALVEHISLVGPLGLLFELFPKIGSKLKRTYIKKRLSSKSFYLSWPNKLTNKAIFKELVGDYTPYDIACELFDFIEDKDGVDILKKQLNSLKKDLLSKGSSLVSDTIAECILNSVFNGGKRR